MYENIANVLDLSREQWLRIRKRYIGGSDCAVVCGLSKFKSPYALCLDKRSDVLDLSDSEAMRVGRDLEEYVAGRFCEATGKKVRRCNFMMRSNIYDFMIADVDRFVVGEDAILECKTTNAYNKKLWDDGAVPVEYELQCHHYMAVTGVELCYIACLIMGVDFVIREVKRDDEVIKMIAKRERDFYERYMVGDELPLPDGSSSYDSALRERFTGGADGECSLADYDLSDYFRNKELIKDLQEQNKVIEQKIQLDMGNFNYGVGRGFSVSWKPYVSKRFDSKAFKAAYPDLYKEFLRASNARRFMIKGV